MNYISSTENAALMARARESLKGKWGLAIGAWIVIMVLVNIGSETILWESEDGNRKTTLDIIGILINGPLSLGYAALILTLSRNQSPQFTQLFGGFKRFGVALGAFLLQCIFIILWLLLLIVPGIIAILRYSQTWYILVEDENIGPLDAINKSKEMMKENKWKLFCLYGRFLGWFLLCFLTLGVGFIFIGPYVSVSLAKFYDDLKSRDIANKFDVATEKPLGESAPTDLPTDGEQDENAKEENGENSKEDQS